jgi:transposase-like protein
MRPAPVEDEPPPPRIIPFLARVERWRRRLREERAQAPSREALEALEAERVRLRQERIEDEIARVIAAQGCYFPGDELDLPRPSRLEPNSLGGWWLRW